MSNIPKTGWTKFWSDRVMPIQNPSRSQGAGIAGENGFWVWKVSSRDMAGGFQSKFSGKFEHFCKVRCPVPPCRGSCSSCRNVKHSLCAGRVSINGWLPRPQKFQRKSFTQTKAYIFNCFEAYNVAVQRSECRTSPQKINQLFPTLCPFFSAINIERKAGGMKILQ